MLKGFSQGADDHIVKPFSLPILRSRIDNIFKMKKIREDNIIFKGLKLDLKAKSLDLDGDKIDLNLKEFSLLQMLLENKDIKLERGFIIDSVWGYDFYQINDNTLTVTVKRLRNKLKGYGKHIKTIRAFGYMWQSDDYDKNSHHLFI